MNPFSFPNRRLFASSCSVFGLGLMLASSLLSGCGASPAEAVTAWEPFKAKDNSFAGQGPTGWEAASKGLGGTQAEVTYTKGNATISAVSDTASSFAADGILRSNPKPVVEQLHESSLTSLGEKLGNLEPQPMQILQSKLGEARYCEFTANNGGTHGYHVTIKGLDRMFYINEYCPESDWATLKPAFTQFIAALKPGTG